MAAAADTPLRFLPGIGPKRAAAFAAAGLHTVWDLLHHVPRCAGEAPAELAAGPLPRNAMLQVRGRVERVGLRHIGRRRSVVEARLLREDATPFTARFFNATYLRERLIVGEWYLFEGRSDRRQAATLNHPRFTHLARGAADPTAARSGCDLAYRLPPGIGEAALRRAIDHALEHHLTTIDDPAGAMAPAAYHQLLLQLHRPERRDAHEAARAAVAQRELLALAWLLQTRRSRVTGRPGRAWRWNALIHEHALARLPFRLTPGQHQACAQIRHDLQAAAPMYRLLQGDVGSGKTALALLACLAVIADGAQALFLAPTAVLAQQHHDFCHACLAGSRVSLGLLTGGTPPAQRERLLARLAAGELDLLIGTHTLLEDRVRTAELGLAVIDEQHKFGVAQRSRLVAKADDAAAKQVDLLVLTATPIPRTLALTLFGDLAVSSITGRPPGRRGVDTHCARYSLPALETAIAEALAADGRAFVVTALVEGSERVEAVDAVTLAQALAQRFDPAEVGLLHGALSETDKLAQLAAFKAGTTRILVATTVIEVGVDVPEANLMAVCDAERFGLAQLHQLRGRIGRGRLPGRCLLLYRHRDRAQRLEVLAQTGDGLRVAEADLADRGPGEFLGTRQHGLPTLAVADLERDAQLLQTAHDQVRAAIAAGQPMPGGLARFLPEAHRAELLRGG